jgi:hypothetical protein
VIPVAATVADRCLLSALVLFMPVCCLASQWLGACSHGVRGVWQWHSYPEFVVRLWGAYFDPEQQPPPTFKLMIQWDIDLYGLEFYKAKVGYRSFYTYVFACHTRNTGTLGFLTN